MRKPFKSRETKSILAAFALALVMLFSVRAIGRLGEEAPHLPEQRSPEAFGESTPIKSQGDNHSRRDRPDRHERVHTASSGSVDTADASAGSSPALMEVATHMLRSLAIHEEKHAVKEAIARESIEESVKRLSTESFHKLFSPRFANPITYGFPVNAFETVEEAKTDPRIARLLSIACCGAEEEKEDLLAAIERNHLAADDESLREYPQWRANSSPLMGIPLILAELDEQGEQLGNLLALTREYIDGEYTELTGSFENPILTGAGSETHYSHVLGSSIETVLINLHKHQLDNGMPIPQSIQEYVAMRETFHAWVDEAWSEHELMSSIPAFRNGIQSVHDYNLLYVYEAGIPGVTFEDYSAALPDWFTPSSAAWLIIGIGARSHESWES